MRYFDVAGDLDIREDGSIGYVSGTDLSVQRLQTAFNSGLGTWRFDRRKGFPWREVFGAGSDDSLIEAIVTDWLLSFPFIVSVGSVEVFRLADREIRIVWFATTDDGVVRGDESI